MIALLLCLALQDDPADVIEQATAQLKEDPTNVDAFFARADAFVSLDKFKEAIADCDEAIRLQPAQAHLYLVRGRARIGLTDLAGAMADLSRAIELRPSFPMNFVQRARARVLAKDEEGAKVDAERALKLDPALKDAVAAAMKGEDPQKVTRKPTLQERIAERQLTRIYR